MYSLDLHGLSHIMAKEEVEGTLLSASALGSFEIEVITGNSKAMKNIVIDICSENNFDYYVPSDNLGTVVVSYTNL